MSSYGKRPRWSLKYCSKPKLLSHQNQLILQKIQLLTLALDFFFFTYWLHMDRVKRIWYLSPMRAAKVQASLRIRAVSPEPPLLAHTSSESRGTFKQKARSLAPLNGWTCAVKICHDGMLEDTNSLDGAHILNLCASIYVIKASPKVTDMQGGVSKCHNNPDLLRYQNQLALQNTAVTDLDLP